MWFVWCLLYGSYQGGFGGPLNFDSVVYFSLLSGLMYLWFLVSLSLFISSPSPPLPSLPFSVY